MGTLKNVFEIYRHFGTRYQKGTKKGEEIVDDPGKDGNASMPEQVKRPNPWRKMMMMLPKRFASPGGRRVVSLAPWPLRPSPQRRWVDGGLYPLKGKLV
jgi:hypothetical protein